MRSFLFLLLGLLAAGPVRAQEAPPPATGGIRTQDAPPAEAGAVRALEAPAPAPGASRGGAVQVPVPADCVLPRDMQDVVESSGVVPPAAAVMIARRQVPNADVVRANLCRTENAFVYVIVALRKDGRVVHVMIDGPSGRVRSVQ